MITPRWLRSIAFGSVALLAPDWRVSAQSDAVVVFNEVHYNPAGPDESGEWIELFNQMGIKTDLSGWRIDGIGFTFPQGTILDPGHYLIVAKSPVSGELGPFTGSISNSGERLRLYNQSERLMAELDFGDNNRWPVEADGSGATLAKRDPYTSGKRPEHWAHSRVIGGTRRAVNFPGPVPAESLVINEIPPASDPNFWVELRNTGSTSFSLGGVTVSVEGDGARSYTLSAGQLASGEVLLLTEATLGFQPLDGEKLFLFDSSGTEVLDGRVVTGRLRGRADGWGEDWLYPSLATPGAANDFLFSDQVVISEIAYNPPALPKVEASPPVYNTVPLISMGETWRYNDTDESLPQGWAASAHAVGGNWKSGAGPLGVESSALPVPLATVLSPYDSSTITYYFETEFSVTQEVAGDAVALRITHQIDDGAVFYLNGFRLDQFNMTSGTVNPETIASPGVDNATLGTLFVATDHLVTGTNRLSVEVHQSGSDSSDIVFGLSLDATIEITPGTEALPLRNSNNQWVEIANRSAAPVDLGGWNFDDGIDIEFSPGTILAPGEHACVARDATLFAAAFPGARILGVFDGQLSRSSERLLLRDANDNPADELRYHEGGRWPEEADGGGATLELRNLNADNSAAESWTASDESGRTQWKTYTYRETAANSRGPDNQWREFCLGLLQAGEVLIDDIRVIQDPDGSATQRLTDTTFDNAQAWRLLGNHRHSEIIDDPDNPGNKVLRLVATGPTEHMHNQVQTPLSSAISNGVDYEISFRARWVSGVNLLHTRLYFNRCANVTAIDRPADVGTPSAPNSRTETNIGPTYADLRHAPAVPSAGEAATVSVTAVDPDTIFSMTLRYSVNGGSWGSLPMTSGAENRYQATIPRQVAGSVVQFYVKGVDSHGVESFFPAGGPDSRALYKVNDGLAAQNGWHNFRIIMTAADVAFQHQPTEVMSNDRLGATVIDREGDIYYDCGARLKSSERGRNQTTRVGYNIGFPADNLYRGVHGTVHLDRSESQTPGQRELLFDLMISNSGGIVSRYNDFVKLLAPNGALTGGAILQMARYEDLFLDSQFEDGSDGHLYEYELIYYPTTADANGLKLPYPNPDGVIGVSVSDLGNDPELYRAFYLNKNNREADEFAPIMAYAKHFSTSGVVFDRGVNRVVDVDNWFRGMAYAVLTGAGDNAATGSQHNGMYYARPDGRVIFFPHDMDFAAADVGGSTTASIFANAECAKLAGDPVRRRTYFGHLHDLISTTWNSGYLSTWTSHLASLDPSQNWAGKLSYVDARANNVLSQINSSIPQVSFAITTASPLNVTGTLAQVSGDGWVNVRGLRLAGDSEVLPLVWTDANSWTVSLPVAPGSAIYTIEALDFSGNVIASDNITIDSSSPVPLASSSNLVISEICYRPAAPSTEETAMGHDARNDFEFLEVQNISGGDIDLRNVRFTSGITFNFTDSLVGTILPAGARWVLVNDLSAFTFRNPGVPSSSIAGEYSGKLSDDGELLHLVALDDSPIRSFTYGILSPWPEVGDGSGRSLVLIAPETNPDHADPLHWRASVAVGGSAGSTDATSFAGDANADNDANGQPDLIDYYLGNQLLGDSVSPGVSVQQIQVGGVTDPYGTFSHRLSLAADDVIGLVEVSTNLQTWNSGPGFVEHVETVDNGDGTVTVTWRSATPHQNTSRLFFRLQAELR